MSVGAGLKAKLLNLGLSLIDNTHLHFPEAVSSLSSLSSKAPIINPVLAEDLADTKEVALH